MTSIEKLDIKILNAKNFLHGQLELYKVEFSETGNNDYLDVMNSLNETIKVIQLLRHNSGQVAKAYRNEKVKNELLTKNNSNIREGIADKYNDAWVDLSK